MLRSRLNAGAACLLLTTALASAQTTPPAPDKSDKATAYYEYSIGHMYSELARVLGNRGDLFNKAVDAYKLAMKADPSATFIAEELSELYIQSGRLRDAVTEAEENLKQNPDDLNARRVLARIYLRIIEDFPQNKIDESVVQKAIEQCQKITEKDPADVTTWVLLGRLNALTRNSVEAEKAYKKALEIAPNDSEALTGLAIVYSDLGNNKGATDLLQKAADKDPNPRTLAALAGGYEQMKDYPLAAATLKRALDLAPGDPEIEKALARDLLFSDQVDEAIKLYEGVVAENPKDIESMLRISQAYRQKHDFVKAREAANKAKALDPDNLEIRYNDVSLLEAEGKNAEAITTLKEILSSTAKKTYSAPDKANRVLLLERLGFLYRTSEQYAPAADAFRQIADLDPDAAPKAEAQIIDTYRAGHDFAKAEQESQAALKKFPNDRVVIAEHAQLLADMGKTDSAVAETKKLLNGKDDRETYISLSQIYEKAKNFPEMAKALEQADQLSTTRDEKENIYFLRGAMYERMKKYDDAEAQFRKVLEINPENTSALNYLGYMFADRGVRLDEAQQLIDRAVQREPNNGAFLDSLGWIYFRLNKLPEAERSLQKALEQMSTDPTVHDHLGDVYLREGKVREAIAQWQSSLKAYQTSAANDMDQDDVAKVQKKLDNAKVRLARESRQ